MLHIEPCVGECETCREPDATRAVCRALKDAKDAIRSQHASGDLILREHANVAVRNLYTICLVNAIQAGIVSFGGDLARLMRDVCTSLETYLNQLPPETQRSLRDATRDAETLRRQPRVTH